MSQEYDVIIVGAGLIGTSLAVALQRQGLNIAILEKHLPDFSDEGAISHRPISLAYGSKEILRTLGLWRTLGSQARAIQEVRVSEQGVLGGVHFKAADYEVDALGYVVSYAHLLRELYQTAAGQHGVSVLSTEGLDVTSASEEQVKLKCDTVAGSKSLTTRLLVGCDGTQSSVRQQLNIKTRTTISTEAAFAASLQLEQDHAPVALERFEKDGVLAILPLQQKSQCGLVWTLDHSTAERVRELSEIELINQLQQRFRGRLPSIKTIKSRVYYNVQTVVASEQHRAGVVLLGNAAHTFYPLAAQGFNLGLRDVAVLAEILISAHERKVPFGSEACLSEYCQLRLQDQKRVMCLTENLTRVFSKKLPLMGGFRGLGMLALDLASPMKTRLAKLTMGVGGRLPKLMRGLPLW